MPPVRPCARRDKNGERLGGEIHRTHLAVLRQRDAEGVVPGAAHVQESRVRVDVVCLQRERFPDPQPGAGHD